MCDELLAFEFLENDNTTSTVRRQRRRNIRDQSDPFQLEESEFIKRYRLSKTLVYRLCDEVRPMLKKPVKSTDLSVETKVLTALSFYATGSYQRPIGDIGGHTIAQQTVSKVISEVTACLNSTEMRRKYITFPKNLDERNKVRLRFYQKFRIPGILGCVDCSHVAIVRPHENEERYYCRKQYHSLNVQLICDAEMNITSVDASYGGATHDSFIWNVHPLKSHLENLNESTWLLVDWQSYPDLNAIDSFLKSKAKANPKNCILKTIGKTVHNKEIKMMKVTNGKSGNTAILIEAGIHGREWLAISSLLYFLDTLTANFSALPGPLRHKDWYIIPVVNPDGYEYTMKQDRMWAKNRRRFSGPCDGVDIMSNFAKFFGQKGTDYDICSREYCGPNEFSEKESIAIRDLIEGVHFKVYVSIHSYGSKFIVPWIGTGRETTNWKTHKHIGNEVIKAMSKVHKIRFTRGTVGPLGAKRTAGTPIDWAYDQGIVHSYLIETRGFSYILPSSEIIPSGEEIAAGLRKLGEMIM